MCRRDKPTCWGGQLIRFVRHISDGFVHGEEHRAVYRAARDAGADHPSDGELSEVARNLPRHDLHSRKKRCENTLGWCDEFDSNGTKGE